MLGQATSHEKEACGGELPSQQLSSGQEPVVVGHPRNLRRPSNPNEPAPWVPRTSESSLPNGFPLKWQRRKQKHDGSHLRH